LKCTVCNEEVNQVQDKDVDRMKTSSLKGIDNSLTRLLFELKRHSVIVSCKCEGGLGHIFNQPTVELVVKTMAQVERIEKMLAIHGFSFLTKLSLSEGVVLSCRIHLKKPPAKNSDPDKVLVVPPGTPIILHELTGLGSIPLNS
jgi:hypothetical protein